MLDLAELHKAADAQIVEELEVYRLQIKLPAVVATFDDYKLVDDSCMRFHEGFVRMGSLRGELHKQLEQQHNVGRLWLQVNPWGSLLAHTKLAVTHLVRNKINKFHLVIHGKCVSPLCQMSQVKPNGIFGTSIVDHVKVPQREIYPLTGLEFVRAESGETLKDLLAQIENNPQVKRPLNSVETLAMVQIHYPDVFTEAKVKGLVAGGCHYGDTTEQLVFVPGEVHTMPSDITLEGYGLYICDKEC